MGPDLIKNEGSIGLTYFNKRSMQDYQVIASKYQVHVESLYPDRFYLVVSRDHPLASHDTISCKSLENLHFASLPCYSSGNSGLLAHSQVLAPNNRYTTFSDMALIKRAVLEYDMAAILSGYTIRYDATCDPDRFKAVRLTGFPTENEMLLCLIHRADRGLCYQEKLVIRCIRDHFKKLPRWA